ncbi:MAG TPA: hypothetical protein ENG63_05300 [Candidatus Desulfofervidus auxilii]|uniref:Uncharacterized protein n=1 Tax=Desulfofervidus auxilii TaxID=1621989 RepID=A0A7C0U2L0_DESA2|nr:hypothetical protein [Candidatus Desulfofervidus auxilii]
MELREFIEKYKVLLVILAIIGIALYSSGGTFSLFQWWGYGCNSIVGSISKVDFLNYDSTLKKSAWLINLVNVPAGADCLVIGNNYIKDTEENTQARNNLYIKTEQIDSKCYYPVTYYDYPIEKMSLYYEKKFFYAGTDIDSEFEKWKDTNCANGYAFMGPTEWKIVGADVLFSCVTLNDVAIGKGNIGTAEYRFASKICVSNGEEEECAVLGTAQIGTETEFVQLSDYIGDVGFAKWMGNLATGKQCFDFEGYSLVYTTNNEWVGTKEEYIEKYDYYRSNLIANLNNCLSKESIDEAVTCLKKVKGDGTAESQWHHGLNYYADLIVYANPYIKELNTPINNLIKNKNDKYSSSLEYDTEFAIQYPSFSLTLDADWVGIYRPEGKPKIISCEDVEGSPREDGMIVVKVKNVADGVGYFAGTINCPPEISLDNTFDEIENGLAKNEQGTLTFYFKYPAVNQKTQSKCSVVVYDKNKPENRDYCYPTITTNPASMCPEGWMRCLGNAVQVCKSNKWITLKYCDAGCRQYMEDSIQKAECISKPVPSCGNGICEPEKGETPQTCPEDCGYPECDYGCEWWDIACKFSEFMCKASKFLSGIIMFAGFGIGVLIIIWLVFKIISKKIW